MRKGNLERETKKRKEKEKILVSGPCGAIRCKGNGLGNLGTCFDVKKKDLFPIRCKVNDL